LATLRFIERVCLKPRDHWHPNPFDRGTDRCREDLVPIRPNEDQDLLRLESPPRRQVSAQLSYAFRFLLAIEEAEDSDFPARPSLLGSDCLVDAPMILSCNEQPKLENIRITSHAYFKAKARGTVIVPWKTTNPFRMRQSKTVDALVVIPGNIHLSAAGLDCLDDSQVAPIQILVFVNEQMRRWSFQSKSLVLLQRPLQLIHKLGT